MANGNRGVKCIVPQCVNVSSGSVIFFGAPSAGSSCFGKWCQFMNLSGHGGEKICQVHFQDSNFINRTRRVLKRTAVPSPSTLKRNVRGKRNRICCIAGCRVKAKDALLQFPSRARRKQLELWRESLHMDPSDTVTGLRICRQHFREDDFQTVKSVYLKPNAVPSRKVKKLVKHPRRFIPSTAPLPPALQDHTYSPRRFVARSKRMCAVYGCSLRAGNGVFLHSFPPKADKRYKAWISALKFGKIPSRNAKVCSSHFTEANYYLGGKYLKADAIPTKNLPMSQRFQNLVVYHVNRISFRKAKTTMEETNGKTNISSSDTMLCDDTDECVKITEQPIVVAHDQPNIKDSSAAADHPPEFEGHLYTKPALTKQPSDVEPMYPNKAAGCEFDEMWYPPEKQSKDFSCQVVAHDLKSRDMILPDLLITDQDVNTWTGIPSLELLQEICLSVQKLETVYPRKWAMHPTDRVILTLAKIKQNLSFAAMGTLFRIHSATVAQYFSHTVHMLAEILSTFVSMPEKKEIQQNIPLCFRGSFSNVTIVLDCTETPIATLKCLNCRISTYSQYKSTRTAKFLIGVTPAGLISYCSNAYSGKASDKFIFNHGKLMEQLKPHIDEVMTDKGFAIDTELSTRGIKLHIPPFLRNNRLSPSEARLNEAIAKARIHVERTIQRIKIFDIVHDTIDANILGHIDDIMSIICGVVNLSNPILRDDKF